MPTDTSGAARDPFSDFGAESTPLKKLAPVSRGRGRTVLACVLLFVGGSLIIGSGVLGWRLRSEVVGAELSQSLISGGTEFRAEQDEIIRRSRLGLVGCAVAALCGAVICRAAYRVYDFGSPTYRRPKA